MVTSLLGRLASFPHGGESLTRKNTAPPLFSSLGKDTEIFPSPFVEQSVQSAIAAEREPGFYLYVATGSLSGTRPRRVASDGRALRVVSDGCRQDGKVLEGGLHRLVYRPVGLVRAIPIGGAQCLQLRQVTVEVLVAHPLLRSARGVRYSHVLQQRDHVVAQRLIVLGQVVVPLADHRCFLSRKSFVTDIEARGAFKFPAGISIEEIDRRQASTNEWQQRYSMLSTGFRYFYGFSPI